MDLSTQSLQFMPIAPFHWIVTICAFVALAAFSTGVARTWRSNTSNRRRLALILFTALSAAALAVAAWNPQIVDRPAPDRVHLAIVLDVSASMQRRPDGWDDVRLMGRDMLVQGLAALPDALRQSGSASLILVGENVRSQSVERLSELLNAYNRLTEDDLPLASGTDLAQALRQAGELIRRSGGRGAILLVSDGNQTTPDALSAAHDLARQGVSIFVVPRISPAPALGIDAADLPRRVDDGQITYLRGIVRNRRDDAVATNLSVAQNPQRTNNIAVTATYSAALTMLPQQTGSIRQALRFEGIGLQFVDLVLESDADNDPTRHHRRLFTHVTRPPRVLAIGGDNRWVAAVTANGAAQVTEIGPEAFAVDSLADYDAVVISDITADRFSDGELQSMANAVTQNGLGLMLINGDHGGRSEEDATVLMSYADTPLAPLLPVVMGPRPYTPEPPARNVVIAVDASGSMNGWPLTQAKAIMRHLIAEFLREEDQLDLLVFTTGVVHLIESMLMDDEGKNKALSIVDAIESGGGTDPRAALALIAGRQMRNCGLIFISDGEFETVNVRPDCRATVFAIGQSDASMPTSLKALADPFAVGQGFNVENIQIPYFEPEQRDKYFEPGDYNALSTEEFIATDKRLPVPDLPLPGNAITYIDYDNGGEVDLIAVRPKFTDPVLAYRIDEAGTVGVLTTAIPDGWIDASTGQEAVEAWILRLIAYTARERYDFAVTDMGETLTVQVALSNDEGNVPVIDRLNARLELPGPIVVDLPLVAVDEAPATFQGNVRPPRGDMTTAAILVIDEEGPDALPRPQRIPFLLPPGGALTTALSPEQYSYGLNEPLLRSLADVSGGQYDPAVGVSFFQSRPLSLRAVMLWPWLVLIAALSYLGAIALQRLTAP